MSDRLIHISRQGTQYGPYPESKIKDLLANGQILPTDLAWFEGADNWQPIENIFMVDTGNEIFDKEGNFRKEIVPTLVGQLIQESFVTGILYINLTTDKGQNGNLSLDVNQLHGFCLFY